MNIWVAVSLACRKPGGDTSWVPDWVPVVGLVPAEGGVSFRFVDILAVRAVTRVVAWLMAWVVVAMVACKWERNG